MKTKVLIPDRTLAEKVSFLLSLLILGIILGLIFYVWLTKETNPPVFEVKFEGTPYEAQEQFYLPFSVKNIGGKTAESVEITVENEKNDQTGHQYIGYLSSGEKESGAFVFSEPPDLKTLTIRVASFKLP